MFPNTSRTGVVFFNHFSEISLSIDNKARSFPFFMINTTACIQYYYL